MKTKLCIAFFLSVFLASSAYAQKPGYMGKRYMAGAEFSYNYGSIPFQYRVFMEYVVDRNLQVGISWFMYNTQCPSSIRMDDERMKGSETMFRVRFYRTKRKGAIAPIGKYFDVGISITANKIIFDPQQLANYERQNIYIPELKGVFLQPSFGWGIQTVFFDCIAADTGIRAGFVPIPVSLSDSYNVPAFMENVYLRSMASFNTRIAYMF
jgi:hypothetical protein